MLDWTEIINFGLPMVILAAIGVALWKFGWYTIHKVFGDEGKGTRGLAGEWVAGEMDWRTKLTERLEKQTNACEGHIETVRAMGDSLAMQIKSAELAKEAASAAAEAAVESSKSLHHIDEMLVGRTDVIKHTAEGVAELKSCAFHICDMCQLFVSREFPNSAAEVGEYLAKIKQRVGDETR